jgi:hypothetical protein
VEYEEADHRVLDDLLSLFDQGQCAELASTFSCALYTRSVPSLMSYPQQGGA